MALRDLRFIRAGIGDLLEAHLGLEPAQAVSRSRCSIETRRTTPACEALVNRVFTPRAVESLHHHIQQIVDQFLDRVEAKRAMDVIADLASPLPVTVICEMLGVPANDRDLFRQWSLHRTRSLESVTAPVQPEIIIRGNGAREALTEYVRSLVADRPKRPQLDLVSALIAAEAEDDQLSEPELLATCVLLLVAGHDTTVNLISNGVLALLRHPDQLTRLREDPTLTHDAIEELLRYDGPVQRTGRIAATAVEVGGKRIAKGSVVSAVIGAANRDPARFPDPDRRDLARRDTRHIPFGFGIHFCLGAPVARLEGQIALGTLIRRMPGLTLLTAKPAWRETTVFRGRKALPVAF